MENKPEILYEDAALLVVKKPAGVDAQASRGFGADMVSLLQNYLAAQQKKPGTVPYVGVVHRLDKPVCGVMVYAKTKTAAAALGTQLQKSQMHKVYYALVCGTPEAAEGLYEDLLVQDRQQNRSRIVKPGDPQQAQAKPAVLRYRVVAPKEACFGEVVKTLGWERFLCGDGGPARSLVRIELLTGRHHQIRVQMAGHGTPLYGDARYQEPECRQGKTLTLCAWSLSFLHPVTGNSMEFQFGKGVAAPENA